MRYWYPMVDEVLEQVIASKPNEIILLPLYPQFSKTTTGSFFEQWESRMRHKGCKILVRKICCYPELPLYINASQDVIQNSIKQNQIPENARYLFSAHGLPKKNIQKGDPYEIHVHMSVDSIVKGLPQIKDHVICYQSKVGPLEWLGPSTEDEIKRACEDQVPMVIVPISFVSENSETLYELDYQYKLYADNLGIKEYYRVPTVRDNSYYISALASMIQTCYQQKCSAKSCDQPCGQYLAA
jgi:ferrochelatase